MNDINMRKIIPILCALFICMPLFAKDKGRLHKIVMNPGYSDLSERDYDDIYASPGGPEFLKEFKYVLFEKTPEQIALEEAADRRTQATEAFEKKIANFFGMEAKSSGAKNEAGKRETRMYKSKAEVSCPVIQGEKIKDNKNCYFAKTSCNLSVFRDFTGASGKKHTIAAYPKLISALKVYDDNSTSLLSGEYSFGAVIYGNNISFNICKPDWRKKLKV